ncbi:MAG: hypothetical protein KJN72_12310 [Woeseia sp.]|nr:hypothetical protein [Woeseia sp.]
MNSVWECELSNGNLATQFTPLMRIAEFRAHIPRLFMGYEIVRFRPMGGGDWYVVEAKNK